MRSLMKIIIDVFILAVVAGTVLFVYTQYKEPIHEMLFGHDMETIFVGDLAVKVTIADEQAERLKGLSGVDSIDDLEGKLFIFDRSDRYGIWMKDMKFPIDIIWINEDLQVVDIKENVNPDTYPRVFRPSAPARFVLEVNAYFAKTFQVEKGDRVNIPSALLPGDVREKLIESQ